MDTYPLNAKVAFETEHVGVSHTTSRLHEPEGGRLTGYLFSRASILVASGDRDPSSINWIRRAK